MTQVGIIERVMCINPDTGVSPWWDVNDLEEKVGFPLRGNGSPFFQTDRGIGVKYTIEKQRKNGNRLSHIRTTGFAPYHQSHKASGVSSIIRKWMLSQGSLICVSCGTAHNIVPDHKDGNKQPLDNADVYDYQSLCQHCNTVKREVCKKCRDTSLRFDARILGYPIPWTEGTGHFQPKSPRCCGCYWYSLLDFKKALRARETG